MLIHEMGKKTWEFKEAKDKMTHYFCGNVTYFGIKTHLFSCSVISQP